MKNDLTISVSTPVLLDADPDAAEIGDLYRKARGSMIDAVHHALQCGQRLLEKKSSLKHGAWLPWLDHNAHALGFDNSSTARRLMKLAGDAKANRALTHDLDESAALTISRKLWANNTPAQPNALGGPKRVKAAPAPVADYEREIEQLTARNAELQEEIDGLRNTAPLPPKPDRVADFPELPTFLRRNKAGADRLEPGAATVLSVLQSLVEAADGLLTGPPITEQDRKQIVDRLKIAEAAMRRLRHHCQQTCNFQNAKRKPGRRS